MDKKNLAQNLFNEATNLRNNGREDEAIVKYREARILFDEMGDKHMVAQIRQMLGVCYTLKGNDRRARIHLKRAARGFKEVGDTISLGNTYRDLGLSHVKKGKFGKAFRWFSKSEAVLKNTEHLVALGITQVKLGMTLIELERMQKGKTLVTLGIRNIRKVGSWFNEMTGLIEMSQILLMKEQFDEMLTTTQAAYGILLEVGEQNNQQRRLAEIYGLLAWGYLKQGNIEYAKNYLNKSEQLLSKMEENVQKIVQRKLRFIDLKKSLYGIKNKPNKR